jgi:hypothetical protein
VIEGVNMPISAERSREIVEKRKATIAAAKAREEEKFQKSVEARAKLMVAEMLAAKEAAGQPVTFSVEESTKVVEKIQAGLKSPSTTPWRPFKRLKIPKDVQDPRFHYHFVDTTKEGNELSMLNEGYEYDKEVAQKLKDRGLAPIRPLKDGHGVDGTYRVNELVLMRIPVEDWEEHQEYYRQQGKIDKEGMKRQMRTDIGKEGAYDGAKVYTDSFGVKDLNQEQFG